MPKSIFSKTRKGFPTLLNAAQKISSLIVSKEEDMMQEILFYLTDVFPDADISLFDMERETFIASTIIENEELQDASRFASGLKKADGKIKRMTSVSPRIPAKLREHIVLAEQYPVSFGKGRFFLLCEYGKIVNPVDADIAALFLNLISIALSGYVLGIDESKDVRLRGREELINDIEHPVAPLPCEKTLAVISLRDARTLNQEIGYAQVDEYLAYIKATLSEHYGSKVYRIGGTKFAVIFYDPVYDIHASVVEILDRFIEKDIPVAAVITPVEDIYSAVYVCETYLKKVQTNSVVVVREKDSKAELATSEELSEVYLNKTFTTLTEDGTEVSGDDIEVINIEPGSGEQGGEFEDAFSFNAFGGGGNGQ